MAWEVRIGGTPTTPGSDYKMFAGLKFTHGVSRIGRCGFALQDIPEGLANPALDDYVEVRDTDLVNPRMWSGHIRSIDRDRETGAWSIMALDPLYQLAKMRFTAPESAVGFDERTAIDSIWRDGAGIGTATTPHRFTTTSLLQGGNGASIDVWRAARGESAWEQISRLALAYQRRVFYEVEDIGGTNYFVHNYKAGVLPGLAAAVFREGRGARFKDLSDDFDKITGINAFAQGHDRDRDYQSSVSTSSRTVDARALDGVDILTNLADTLEEVYSLGRSVMQVETVEPNLASTLRTMPDTGGTFVELENRNGDPVNHSGGDNVWRVWMTEHEPFAASEWRSKLILVRPTIPIIPKYTLESGEMPSVEDATRFAFDHQLHEQALSVNPAGGLNSVTIGATGNTFTNIADDATADFDFNFTNSFGRNDVDYIGGLIAVLGAGTSDDGNWIVELFVGDTQPFASGNILASRLVHITDASTLPGSGEEVNLPVLWPRVVWEAFNLNTNLNDYKSGRLRVRNNSGATKSIRLAAQVYVVERHDHPQ